MSASPAALFELCSQHAMGVFGLVLIMGLQVGKTASWLIIRSLTDWTFIRFLRIVKEPYGPAAWQVPPENYVRYRMVAPSATERTAVSDAECAPYMRIAGAVSGRRRIPGCGG